MRPSNGHKRQVPSSSFGFIAQEMARIWRETVYILRTQHDYMIIKMKQFENFNLNIGYISIFSVPCIYEISNYLDSWLFIVYVIAEINAN